MYVHSSAWVWVQGSLRVDARLRFALPRTPFVSSRLLIARRICSLFQHAIAFLDDLESIGLIVINPERILSSFCGRTDQKISKEHVWPIRTLDVLWKSAPVLRPTGVR
jgi:hypothetical protein